MTAACTLLQPGYDTCLRRKNWVAPAHQNACTHTPTLHGMTCAGGWVGIPVSVPLAAWPPASTARSALRDCWPFLPHPHPHRHPRCRATCAPWLATAAAWAGRSCCCCRAPRVPAPLSLAPAGPCPCPSGLGPAPASCPHQRPAGPAARVCDRGRVGRSAWGAAGGMQRCAGVQRAAAGCSGLQVCRGQGHRTAASRTAGRMCKGGCMRVHGGCQAARQDQQPHAEDVAVLTVGT